MAERRMLSKKIVDSDAFLDMSISAQNLYFHLNLRADDDGFINNPKSIMRLIGSSLDDMNILIAKKFIIPFDTGVIVIKHWRLHNSIQKDRYHPTTYQEELACLELDENKSYRKVKELDELPTTTVLTIEAPAEKQDSKHKHGDMDNVFLTDAEYEKLKKKFTDVDKRINDLSYYIASTGKKYKSHYSTILAWDRKNSPAPVVAKPKHIIEGQTPQQVW